MYILGFVDPVFCQFFVKVCKCVIFTDKCLKKPQKFTFSVDILEAMQMCLFCSSLNNAELWVWAEKLPRLIVKLSTKVQEVRKCGIFHAKSHIISQNETPALEMKTRVSSHVILKWETTSFAVLGLLQEITVVLDDA